MEPLNHYLFIDIETTSGWPEHGCLSEGMKREWAHKAKGKWKCEEAEAPELFFEKAGILAEFGKIVCISMGCFVEKDGEGRRLLIRSIAGHDESALLDEFCASVSKFYKNHRDIAFVGHNIVEFDLPYISRRMIIQGKGLPQCMDFQGKKPWEIKDAVKDTMQLWSFGDYKSYTKLSLLAEVLGIPSPKDDINGEDVTRVYWHEKDLPRIVNYCQKDVGTTARVFMRLTGRSDVDFATEILEEHMAA